MKKSCNQSFDDALKVSIRFIKYRPRTKKEVFDKLKSKDFSQEVILSVLKYLEEESIIDEKSFALEWLRERLFSKMLGKKKAILELRKKGISDEIINEAIDEVFSEEDEKEIALKFLNYKFAKTDKNLIDKTKLKKLLLSRGYSYQVSEEVVKNFLRN